MAEELGVTETRYGLTGKNHQHARQGREQPVLHLRSDEVHRLLALRAGVRRSAGHVRADDSGPRLRFEGLREPERAVPSPPSACRAAPASRRVPTGALTEKSLIQLGPPERVVTTTCAYCGVGCSFNAEVKGDRSSAWRRIATATPTTATPASRADSPSAMRRILIASRRR